MADGIPFYPNGRNVIVIGNRYYQLDRMEMDQKTGDKFYYAEVEEDVMVKIDQKIKRYEYLLNNAVSSISAAHYEGKIAAFKEMKLELEEGNC